MIRSMMNSERVYTPQKTDWPNPDSGVKKPAADKGAKRKHEAKDGSGDGKMTNPDKSVRIPDKEFQRGLKAKRCVMCNKGKTRAL